ncbi:hypothetical protein PUNSTDRAFT_92315 [Punctularia strigosozonata HHB-11173 SS5]|uniref:Endonuclease/exonuclease/phosphatase domain-containing protein n=1 Tax=Punctularia strigosozonata (strain HHB-11173) TaxID=741275 RepID=R7S5Q5_PUNST|nr:uncharacterized protein PUNSTDRAFT_92315 [Punctularia strigosozonata HHB-11173 SS5]EIN04876.1 hypothetical protein PUNSTDRAFT_92315 [Punctularia strigosozonata HHB-11173 SS5]
MQQGTKPRLAAALAHLRNGVFKCADGGAPEPCCILLQEVHEGAFSVIMEDDWIRNHFVLVPEGPNMFPIYYGQVTLVARTIPVQRAYSLEFQETRMGRTALFVDVLMSVPTSEGWRRSTMRIANTHLESLPEGFEMRPIQMSLISRALQEGNLAGGIVCGDMNVIRREDESLAEDAGLQDAWNGKRGDKSGHTWGYQPRGRFPPGRLDRIFFTKNVGFNVDEPTRIGEGVRWGPGPTDYVSDHFGLLTTVSVL